MEIKSVSSKLSVRNHAREVIGLTYIYPVISRRAQGVSVGINLNPNNACNWRCIYCQVPNLKRGAAPPINMNQLKLELRSFLKELLAGDFMEKYVPIESRSLKDIAISGNGEPTSAREFAEVVSLIGEVMQEFKLIGKIKLTLITNGSLMQRSYVQQGLRRMAKLNGEVWFKMDSATPEGVKRINNVAMTPMKILHNLRITTRLCSTWVQTCLFKIDGKSPSQKERKAYLDLLRQVKEELPIQGVMLYGLARVSQQPEATRLSALPKTWLNSFAAQIRRLGITVKVSV